MIQELAERIETLITPILGQAEVELVDLNIHRSNKKIMIEMLVDKYSGGITLDECSRLNKEIGDLLEQQNLIQERYILEVASPGMDRPLKTVRDFERVINKKVRIFLSEPVNGKGEYAGVVKGIGHENVIVVCDSDTMTIPISKINKSKQII